MLNRMFMSAIAASAFLLAGAGAASAESVITPASWGTENQEALYNTHSDMTRKASAACEDTGGSAMTGAQMDDLMADQHDTCVVKTLDSMVMQSGDTGLVLVHMALPKDARYNVDRSEVWEKRAMDGDLVRIEDE